MATLIYNNVRLDAITTVEHTARVVYDPGGTDYPLKTAQQYAAAWAQGIGMAGAGALSLAAGGPLGAAGAAAGAFGVAELLYNNALATCNLSGVCQVTGAPGADRMYLARVAQSLVADRCRSGGFNSAVTPVVTRVSVDWSSQSPPWAEFMAVYRVPMTKVLGMFIRGDDALSLLNWSDTLKGTPDFPLNNWGRDTPRAQLPGGDNTRAESVGRLVTQVLSSAGCEVPGLVAAPGDVPRGRLTKATNTRQINSDFQSGG